MSTVWIALILAAALVAMQCRPHLRGPRREPAATAAAHWRPPASGAARPPGTGEAGRRRPPRNSTTLESQLEEALDRQQFVLHYQPEVALDSHTAVGLEALLRWRHPVRGLLGPDAFIPTAEQSQLIVPLGRWVLDEACQALSRLQHYQPGLRMAVNVSPHQIDHDRTWAYEVLAIAARAGVNPGALTVELTETMLMRDPQRCAAALHTLRDAGLGVAIDDFGTGYSSLAYLDDLPASIVKLDQRFVQRLEHDHRQRDIVRCIADLATCLGMAVTAEGVEQRRQAHLLQTLGCTTAQGFYFSPPIAEQAAAHYLHRQRPGTPLLTTVGRRYSHP